MTSLRLRRLPVEEDSGLTPEERLVQVQEEMVEGAWDEEDDVGEEDKAGSKTRRQEAEAYNRRASNVGILEEDDTSSSESDPDDGGFSGTSTPGTAKTMTCSKRGPSFPNPYKRSGCSKIWKH